MLLCEMMSGACNGGEGVEKRRGGSNQAPWTGKALASVALNLRSVRIRKGAFRPRTFRAVARNFAHLAMLTAIPVWMTPGGVRPRWAGQATPGSAEAGMHLFRVRFGTLPFDPRDNQAAGNHVCAFVTCYQVFISTLTSQKARRAAGVLRCFYAVASKAQPERSGFPLVARHLGQRTNASIWAL